VGEVPRQFLPGVSAGAVGLREIRVSNHPSAAVQS
jgi:hypothetical protein